MIKKEELFPIGYLAKPHGIRGELSLHTDYATVLEDLENPYLICEMDGLFVPFFIEMYRPKKASVVLVKFENVNDEPAARRFSNKTAYCPLEIMRNLPTEVFAWNSFAGYLLKDHVIGELGRVVDVDDSTINILFKVEYQGKDLLVPIAEDLIVSVDHESQRLVVALPEGLIDL